jgi:hypothetical protein
MIDPCGYVMDLARSCYKRDMVFFDGPGGTVPVQWYFVPDNTPALPGGFHYYGSGIWDSQGPTMIGLGDNVQATMTYTKGAIPGTPNTSGGPCGPISSFQNGVPVGTPGLALNGNGLPICCFGSTCQPFYDGTIPQNASLHDSFTGLRWNLFFQDQGDVEFFDPTMNWFVDIESNGVECTVVEGTMVPALSWILPGIPTADSCQFVSYDPVTFTGTYQFFAGANPLVGKYLFFTLPPP